MCLSSPDVPEVPERQAARTPAKSAVERSEDKAKRRMAMAATMLTGSRGTLGAPATTGAGYTGG
jgi:hypothetical protein